MTIISRRTDSRRRNARGPGGAELPRHAGRLLFLLAVAGGCAAPARAATLALTSFEAPDVMLGIDPLSASWDSGDLLVARIDEQGAVGGFTGKKNAVIIPAIRAFGRTITPAVRADTRLGARLTSDIDLYAGAQLFADASTGGYSTPVSSFFAPTLTAPGEVRAGSFVQLQGSTGLGSDSAFGLSLPALRTGIDVVAGGSASFKLEGAVPLVMPYRSTTTRLDLGDQSATVFEVGVDFARGQDPSYVPVLEVLGTNIAPPIPEFDEIRVKLPPANPLANFGEVAVVDPAVSRVLEERSSTGSTATTAYTGDLFRAAMDLDGILSFAVTAAATGTGVSYSGLETSIPGLGRAFYDILDVKYGVEVGYRESSIVEARLGATLDFFAAGTDTPIDVLTRTADGSLIASTLRVEDWEALPAIALLSAQDVDVRVQFTDLERTLTRTLDLTIDDYMEIKAWQIGIDFSSAVNRAGLNDPILGPLAHLKLELADELSVGLLHDTVGQLRDTFDATTWAPTLFTLRASQVADGYLADAAGSLTAGNLRRLDTHLAPASLAATRIVIGTATTDARTLADVTAVNYVDAGQQRSVTSVWLEPLNPDLPFSPQVPRTRTFGGISDPLSTTSIDGLVIPEGATYELQTRRVRRFRLNSVDNDGLVRGGAAGSDSTYLEFGSLEADGLLSIRGDGEMTFAGAGGIEAGVLLHGAGHTLSYDALTPYRTNFPSSGPSATLMFTDPGFYLAEANGSSLTRRTLIASDLLDNAGHIVVDSSTLDADIGRLENQAAGSVLARNGATLRIDSSRYGRTGVVNAGLIEAVDGATLQLDSTTVGGSVDPAAPGRFRATQGGLLDFVATAAIDLDGALDFHSAEGGTIRFASALVVDDGDTDISLHNDVGGTLVFNGLQRRSATAGTVRIVNHGLLDFVSGVSSLVITPCVGIQCPLLEDDPTPTLVPIDLDNQGTVRIHAGAEFAFDVDLVDYAEGGARLAGGSWELLGANTRFANTTALSNANRPQTAVMSVRVADVFGNAEKFGDLGFGEVRDGDTGQVLISGEISALDTALRINAANVTLSGAAKFDYFNTVRTNLGTLNLRNQHQFHTVESYENRGGVTRVESSAGLHVNGALVVDGGSVHIGSGSELSIAGSLVDRGDGSLERRDIEVTGGTLDIQSGAILTGGLVGFGRFDGLSLSANRSWIVRERVVEAEDGSEIVTPGVLSLGIRTLSLLNDTAVGSGAPAGVIQNDAHVVFDGEAARFDAVEHALVDQRGTLVLRNGKSYVSPKSFFHNTGTVLLEGAQFALTGSGNEFRNDGMLGIDAASYLAVDFFNQVGGSLQLDGALDTRHLRVADVETVSGAGLLRADLIEIDGAGVFDLAGGTLIADELRGSLNLDGGVFAVFAGTGRAAISGDYRQAADALLEIDWGDSAADLLEVAGTATLAGGIRLNLLDGFVPDIGSTLEILRAGARLGDFDSEALFFAAGTGRAFALRYETQAVFIDVMAAPVPLPASLWLSASALALLVARRRCAAVS